MSRKPLLIAAAVVAVALTTVSTALADQLFHTSHAAVHSVAGAPLRRGLSHVAEVGPTRVRPSMSSEGTTGADLAIANRYERWSGSSRSASASMISAITRQAGAQPVSGVGEG